MSTKVAKKTIKLITGIVVPIFIMVVSIVMVGVSYAWFSTSAVTTISTITMSTEEAFTLSFATKNTVVASDYVGIISQNKEPNKIKKAGLTVVKSNKVHAPIFNEYPLTMECEVISFNEEEGILIGKVINVSVSEEIIKDGKIDTTKLEAIVFDPINNKYRLVGEAVADAFKVGLTLK